MSEKVREFWFIKNNLGTAICFAEIPPSKSYKKYIDKSAYDRLAEINKVLVEGLDTALRQWEMYVTDYSREDLESIFNVEANELKRCKQLFAKGKEMRK